MKRVFSIAALALLGSPLIAQTVKTDNDPKSFLTLNAGISLPIICYSRTDLSKNNFAGFARMGFTLELGYGYLFTRNIGIAGKAFYSSNATDSRVVAPASQDHYRYFGVMAGPLVSTGIGGRAHADFQFSAGIARAISPRIVYNNEVLLNHDASTAFAWGGSAGLRYDLTGKTYLSFMAEHTQLKPKFNQHKPDESLKNEQHITVVNFDAGIGFRL
jgi:hypothetical protein